MCETNKNTEQSTSQPYGKAKDPSDEWLATMDRHKRSTLRNCLIIRVWYVNIHDLEPNQEPFTAVTPVDWNSFNEKNTLFTSKVRVPVMLSIFFMHTWTWAYNLVIP